MLMEGGSLERSSSSSSSSSGDTASHISVLAHGLHAALLSGGTAALLRALVALQSWGGRWNKLSGKISKTDVSFHMRMLQHPCHTYRTSLYDGSYHLALLRR